MPMPPNMTVPELVNWIKKPAPALKPEPKLMTREQLAAIYGTRHADAVMGLRAIKRRAE